VVKTLEGLEHLLRRRKGPDRLRLAFNAGVASAAAAVGYKCKQPEDWPVGVPPVPCVRRCHRTIRARIRALEIPRPEASSGPDTPPPDDAPATCEEA